MSDAERNKVIEECQRKLQSRADELRRGMFVSEASKHKIAELEFQVTKLGKMKGHGTITCHLPASDLANYLHEHIDDWRNSSRLHENEERILLYVKSLITKWFTKQRLTDTHPSKFEI